MKFVVNCIALSLANLLQDHLLRSLCRDPSQHVGRLCLCDLAANLHFRLLLPRIADGNLAQRVGDLFHNRAHRKHVHMPGIRIELRAQILLGAVVFPRRYDHRVFNGRDDHLGLDVLLPADLLDCLVQQTRHPSSP